MSKQDFWEKRDLTSMARSIRLATIQNVFDQGLLTEKEARDLLSGPLNPEDESSVYDDSDCLEVRNGQVQ